jgi:hypothetical protein
MGITHESFGGDIPMPTEREEDLQLFGMWLSQLNHEDYLLVARGALGMLSQPVFVLAYIFSKYYQLEIVSKIIVWSNLVLAILIYASIIAAFRVYIETRIKIRPILIKHPDFPMRRLPNIRPGWGLYCPVALSLIMVVIWSSFLYIQAEDDAQRMAAIFFTVFLALAGIAFAIGAGTILGKSAE